MVGETKPAAQNQRKKTETQRGPDASESLSSDSVSVFGPWGEKAEKDKADSDVSGRSVFTSLCGICVPALICCLVVVEIVL